MKIGLSLGQFSWPVPVAELAPRIAEVARFEDGAGFASLWVMDHFFQIRLTGEAPESPMPEGWSLLAYLAGQTSRIELGTSVTSVAYRHPAILVKVATTVDMLSGGRTWFGVGAGVPWSTLPPHIDPRNVETTGLGIPMPPLAERFDRLEELLQIALAMWSDSEEPFDGRFHHLERPLNSPTSVRRPHPPILIGGSGERRTLPLVARYADACNLFDLPGTEFAGNLQAKLDVLQRLCDEVGRDYATIQKTCASTVDLEADPTASAYVEHLRDLAAVGIEHVLVAPRRPWDLGSLEAFAAALPEIHAITSA